MNSALVIGGDGLIGRALTAELLSSRLKVVSTSRSHNIQNNQIHFDLDVGADNLLGLIKWVPDVVYICAAVTGFAACANNPTATYNTNVTQTVELASHFIQQGSRVVYLSSNAVFDGTRAFEKEISDVSPVSEYGRQKAECEKKLLDVASRFSTQCYVVRLTKVVDISLALYSDWINAFELNLPVKAAIDLTFCPISSKYVVDTLKMIGSAKQGGIFHLSGEKDITYFDLANTLMNIKEKSSKVEQDLIQNRLGLVPSPQHTALSMEHTSKLIGILPQPIESVARDLMLKI